MAGAGAASAEFAPALLIFLLIILFPLINLIMFTSGVGTAYLCAKQAASRASTQSTYTEALQVVQQESAYFVSSGFGKFAKLAPIGGVAGSGIDLSVIATPYGGGATTQYPANSPIPVTASPDNNTYEYKVRAAFNIGPFMDLSSFPLIAKGVPRYVGIPI